MTFRDFTNRRLDSLARATIHIRRAPCSPFRVCAFTGLLCAVLLTVALAACAGLSLWVIAALVIAWILTILAQAYATKIVTGEEQFACYRHAIALVAVTSIVLWLLHQPILPYLDLTIIFCATLVSWGRVGCLLVGCCHGRPHPWGVAYRDEHAELGFPQYLVGVRLFPIQAVEAIWVMCIVAAGSFMILESNSPGTAFSAYAIAYTGGRFCFEFLRGDVNRPHWAGFSEAQWTSVGIAVFIVAAEIFAMLPLHVWHLIAAVCVVVLLATVAIVRTNTHSLRFKLKEPRHILELAEAIERISSPGQRESSGHCDVKVSCTSLGVLISGTGESFPHSGLSHFAISLKHQTMDVGCARMLAKLICQLRGYYGPAKVFARTHAVFHLIFRRDDSRPLLPR